MSSNKKSPVKRTIQQSKATVQSPRNQQTHHNDDESVSDRYIYSDTFEDQSALQVGDSYSDTFVNTANASDKNGCTTTDIRTVISLRTSEIQEASNLETARTEMLETVIEVESDVSYSEGIAGTLKTYTEVDTTRDISHDFSDTRPTDSHTYSDTFESSEKSKIESQSYVTPDSSSYRSSYTESSSTYAHSQGDESLLDRSYIAPDYDGKSLTDDEDDYADTYNDEYSYTFEPTESTTYVPHDPEQAMYEAEQIDIGRQAEKDFVKSLVVKLKSKPEKKFIDLETIPTDGDDDVEDEYLKHYCRKMMKLLKTKTQTTIGVEEGEGQWEPDLSANMHHKLSHYGIPDSTLERAKITNIMSAMRRAAKEEIHDPRKCPQCREVKSRLDMEDSQRQFVTAHAKRLKNKLMDAKVEEHLLKMNSISMIGELARELPRPSEKPEKIFDKLFEPLLGKNVMR